MQRLPAGLVTFAFTDIEGSTRMWEIAPEQMSVALERHDQLVRDTVEAHSGSIFSMAGDGFGAAFGAPTDAMNAVADLQRRLADEPWPDETPIRVRIGLHAGEAEQRDGDYFGTVVNRTARLMAAGHGGQVLMSQACRALVPDRPAIDLGMHRLKDLSAAEHIWQLELDHMPKSFPPLRTLDPTSINLPIRSRHLVGRDSDAEHTAALLDSHRVVTVCGPGGVGKTSLVLQVAADIGYRYEAGVWLVELAPLTDPAVLPFQFLDTLGISADNAGEPLEAITKSIGEGKVLLAVDNCEHVREEVASLLRSILAACPNFAVLASSREPLGLAGEVAKRIEPLGAAGDESPAVTLFIERALETNPALEISERDRATIAQLCESLDGLPLAIELAAARTGSLTIDDLRDRVDQRFRVLRSRTAADDRHATLRDTIGWSHQMLDADERTLFERLSVFAGDFSLAAAEAVCADDVIDELEIFDLLDRLVARSMVVADVAGPKARYSLLQSLKDFGAEELGDEYGKWRSRHALEYAGWMRSVVPTLYTDREEEALVDLDEGWDDLRVAVRHARDTDDRELFEQLVDGLSLEVLLRSRAEAAEWADWQRSLSGEPSTGMVAVQTAAASIKGRQDDVRAHGARLREMELAGEPVEPFDALVVGLAVHLAGAPDEALEHYDWAIEQSPGPEGRVTRGWTAVLRGLLYLYTGRPELAEVEVAKARELAVGGGMSKLMGAGLELVDTLRMVDPPARIIERSIETSNLAARLRSRLILNVSEMLQATARDELGDVGKAHEDAARILTEQRRSDYLAGLSQQLRRAAVMLMRVEQYEEALLVLAWLDRQQAPQPNPATGREIDELRPIAIEHLGEAAYADVQARAVSTPRTEVVDLAAAALRASIPDESDDMVGQR